VSTYGSRELAASFRTVRKNTIAVAQDIPADKYNFRGSPDTRSVGELLTHIAMISGFANEIHRVQRAKTLQGFDFMSLVQRFGAEEKAPRNKEQIIVLLQTNGEDFAKWLDSLDDNFLAEHVQMPEGAPVSSKSRLELLLSVKEHEMHHRAQLMLIQRMLGITPHLTREMQARFAQHAQAQPAGATKNA
jgi:uncharacterized damage-inducible protein DinB